MNRTYNAFAIDSAIPLHDDLYYTYLLDAVRQARHRIWASVFIINVSLCDDPNRRVRTLLKALNAKRLMGLDVRVIVGISKENTAIRIANQIALEYLRGKGVLARPYRGAKSSTHSKYVVVDDSVVIVGSHNWTDSGFAASIEDSIAIRSKELNDRLALEFLTTWVV